MSSSSMVPSSPDILKKDSDSVFFELTRSICPVCRRVIDAHILLREDKVYMRKRCPEHGPFEALIYADAEAYVASARFNKPGTLPLKFSTEIDRGCPHDCGLCPDHQQHACLGIIEVNSACNMDCPLCFADAGAGFNLTLEEVEGILDHFVETEGQPDAIQFSGGEPTIHPEIIPMLEAATRRNIRHVMINTNGKRIATDDEFLEQLAGIDPKPAIYFQFDGFESETYRILRGEADILDEKLRALDRLADIGCTVVLVPAVERNVNEHELGAIVRFGIDHPAVRGITFQPAFHSGRHGQHDPMTRMTNPDIISLIEAQTDGLFVKTDFFPVPCCFPTCNSMTYAYVEGDTVLPLPRFLNVEDYLDYVSNRLLPDIGEFSAEIIQTTLEGLWSSSAVPGTKKSGREFALSCSICGLLEDAELAEIADRVFMIALQDFLDPWTFNQKNVMKCCKVILLPDGKQIPFCAYNNIGYREQARGQLAQRQRARRKAEHEGLVFDPQPLTFSFHPNGTS
ncbi:MAG: radical SAM protein, partial [Chloroflexi bacterium]|nr:radical SAM protein [Chloroflexota bacterium]